MSFSDATPYVAESASVTTSSIPPPARSTPARPKQASRRGLQVTCSPSRRRRRFNPTGVCMSRCDTRPTLRATRIFGLSHHRAASRVIPLFFNRADFANRRGVPTFAEITQTFVWPVPCAACVSSGTVTPRTRRLRHRRCRRARHDSTIEHAHRPDRRREHRRHRVLRSSRALR